MFGFEDDQLARMRKDQPATLPTDPMFGFQPGELRAARRPRGRWLRWLLRLFALGILGALLLLSAGLWVLATPEGAQRVVDLANQRGRSRVLIGDLELDANSVLWRPDSWRVHAIDVRILPPPGGHIEVTIARVSVGLPDLELLRDAHELSFGTVTLVGLDIHAQRQRPGPAWKIRSPFVQYVSARKVEVWDAGYRADPDPPLSAAAATRIYGTLEDVSYQTGNRKLSGHGTLTLSTFHTGALEVQRVRLGQVQVDEGQLQLQGTLHFGDAEVALSGTIGPIERHPTTRLKVVVHDAQLQDLVRRASGRRSPIRGRLDAQLTIHGGGDIPRGRGWMRGRASLHNALIPLGSDVNNIVRDLLRVAPYLTLGEDDAVHLKEMDGVITFGRGWVDLEELRYKAPKRTIQLRGHLDGEVRHLVIRLMPTRDADVRPGLGLVLHGTSGQMKLRIAKRWDLLPKLYDAEPAGLSRKERRQFRRAQRSLLRARVAGSDTVMMDDDLTKTDEASAPERAP